VRTERPNVVLIMVDQMKAAASSLYGNPQCPTPSLERLARAGVAFDRAVTPHPLCVPARIALWTSQFPDRNGCRTNERLLPAGRDHAFRRWRAAGFETALIGKNHSFQDPQDIALFDVWCEISHQGFPPGAPHRGMDWVHPPEPVTAAHAVRRQMPPARGAYPHAATDFPLEHYSTGLVTDQACAYLARAREPFALWLSYPDPHSPYEAPRRYRDAIDWRALALPEAEDPDDPALPERNRVLRRILGWDESALDDLRQAVATYYAMIRFVDDGVGRVLDALERLGLTERTIVVFCSDHGDFAGEHRMMNKGGVFYDCLTRVPLIVSWPGRVPEGRRESGPVNLVDVVPTLFSLQDLAPGEDWEGELLPMMTKAPSRERTVSLYGAGGPAFSLEDWERLPVQRGARALMDSLAKREAEGERSMIRTRRWKLVHDPSGTDRDEFYDLEQDPHELCNRAGAPEHAAVETELRDALLAWRRRPRPSGAAA